MKLLCPAASAPAQFAVLLPVAVARAPYEPPAARMPARCHPGAQLVKTVENGGVPM